VFELLFVWVYGGEEVSVCVFVKMVYCDDFEGVVVVFEML